MKKKEVILVDRKNREIGIEEKLKAHQEGKLHRSFSIFVFNKNGELLIQRRAKSKYHSGGLWSNTCCSHPRPGKNLIREAKRRLKEEMEIKCDLKEIFSFYYKVKVGKLIEHEFDHVFFGKFDKNPKPDLKEAEDWKWIKLRDLKKDVKKNPSKYTVWFKIILERAPKEAKTLFQNKY
jgi:isopentenyl-diphosphate delta-isomerase